MNVHSWSNDIGIRLYLAGNPTTDVWTLVVGILGA